MISPADLLNPARQDLLYKLNSLVNDAYFVHGHPREDGGTGPLYTEMRISAHDQLVHELGPHGLLAVCFDDNLPEMHMPRKSRSETLAGAPYVPGKYGNIVATASLKPFKGKTIDVFRRAQQQLAKNKPSNGDSSDMPPLTKAEFLNAAGGDFSMEIDQHNKTWNWEVAACASVNDAKYRGQGLMIRCLNALVEELIARRNTIREAHNAGGELQVKLWSSSLDGSGNTEYWIRRGFVEEGPPDVAPKGVWTSTREFRIQTLSKIVG